MVRGTWCTVAIGLGFVTAFGAAASSNAPSTPQEAFKLLSRSVVGKPPGENMCYVAGRKPFVIVTLPQDVLGRTYMARTPFGKVYARRYDRDLPGLNGETGPMDGEGIVVNAPKSLEVVLHAPFTPAALTINGNSAYTDDWRRMTVQAKWNHYSGPPSEHALYAIYGTIVLPGGRTTLEYVVE